MRLRTAIITLITVLTASSVFANTLGFFRQWRWHLECKYSSEEMIAGFQFNVDGARVNSASGGDATANGFMISANATTVLGFSLTGGTIPAGSGTLVVLDLAGTPSGLSGIVMSDPSGNAIEFTYDSGAVAGCTDMDACNYNGDATADDGSCDYPSDCSDCDGGCTCEVDCAGDCGGSAEVDECGECGGGGIDEGACDCDGNILDECGECDGDGIDGYCHSLSFCGDIDNSEECITNLCEWEGVCDCYGNVYDCTYDPQVQSTWESACGGTAVVDECGVCGGTAVVDECGVCGGSGIPDGECDCDGNVDLGCGCGEAGPSGCDNACGSTAEVDECGICDE